MIKVVCWGIIFTLLSSCFGFESSIRDSTRSACRYSRQDLLAMKVEEAFQILLDYHEDSCSIYPQNDRPKGNAKGSDERGTLKTDHSLDLHYDRVYYKHMRKTQLHTHHTPKRESAEFSMMANHLQNKTSVERDSKTKTAQFDILSQFHLLLDGERWFNRYGWLDAGVPVCEWFGIKCDESCSGDELKDNVCPVLALSLPDNDLMGDISEIHIILEPLKLLQLLDISFNELFGSLPDFKLPHLRHLNLMVNEISGTIHDYQGIPSIEYFIAEDNLLRGSVPDFSGLPVINTLLIGICEDISGELPNFKSMPNIKQIGIYETQLNGTLPDFGDLPKSQTLVFYNNRLNGTIPNFARMPFLTEIDFSANYLKGSMPEFNHSPNMMWIYLLGNHIDGTIPDLIHIPSLVGLDLSGNQFTGTIPDFIHVSALTMASINSNDLIGTIPDFTQIPRITILNLSDNNITGTIPDFTWIGVLEILDLSKNELTGTIPEFSNLASMRMFYSHDNQLLGQIPTFQGSPDLEEIVLFRNKLSGTLPYALPSNLTKLDVSENELSGSIPFDWDLPELRYLDLSKNELYGTVPEYFQKLHHLKFMSLAHNSFYGVMPPFFWNLEKLNSVDLRDNEFSEDVGIFINHGLGYYNYTYQTLILDDNNFSGILDEWIYEYVPHIKTLSIRNNMITQLGDVPNLLKWVRFELSGNPITGSIPESYSRFSKLEHFGLKDTLMNHGSVQFLPTFMNHTDPFHLESNEKSYVCPSIKSNSGATYSVVDVNPTYYDYALCKCLPSYFGYGDKCLRCPKECDCSDGVSLKNCYFTPDIIDIMDIVTCLNPDVCEYSVGADISDKKLIKTGEYVFPCKKGYKGRGCSSCEEGFIFESGNCHECSSGFTVVKIVCFVAILVAGVLWEIALAWFGESTKVDENQQDMEGQDTKETVESASLDIFLFYTQILQVIGGIVSLPDINVAGKFVGNLGSLKIPSLECLVGNRPHITSLLNLGRIPSIVFIALLSLNKFRAKKDERRVEKVVAVMFIFLEGTYFSVVQDVISSFGCTLYDKGHKSWYVNAYPWIRCNPITGDYGKMLGAAFPGLIYMIAYPALLWLIVKRSRTIRKEMEASKDPSVVNVEKLVSLIEANKSLQLNLLFYSDKAVKSRGNSKKSLSQKSIREANKQGSSSGIQGSSKNAWERDQPNGNKTGINLSLGTFDLVCQIQMDRFSAIYEDEYDWWVVVHVIQSIVFGFTVFVVPYTSPAILYFVVFILIQSAMALQNRFQPYRLESDDKLSTNCWLVLYISFFAALVKKLIPGNDWIVYAIIALNGVFIAAFLVPYIWGIMKSATASISKVTRKVFAK